MMKARHISYLIACMIMLCCLNTQAQNAFPYPALPDTLRSVEQRATYLSEHYWDNYQFADTTQLKNEEITEQGFVNFIDILARFNDEIAQKGISAFTAKAYVLKPAKEKFESLIEHYFDDPQSPMRNDRVYSFFLAEMKKSPYFDEAEKERIDFKWKAARKNLPGTKATNLSFKLEDGKMHQLTDYQNEKVILYFHDPECENCHKVTAWLKKQTIPAEYRMLRIIADDQISATYSIKAMPTIYLLDKGNIVVLKDCTPEVLSASAPYLRPRLPTTTTGCWRIATASTCGTCSAWRSSSTVRTIFLSGCPTRTPPAAPIRRGCFTAAL